MAKVALTGATGFLGSQMAAVLTNAGHEVLGLTRAKPRTRLPWAYEVVDTNDPDSLTPVLAGCDAVIHAAIANDFQNLDSQAAYRAYPGLTSAVTRSAQAVGAQPIYISTDWVMEGTTPRAPETSIGRPVNTYGYLKALGEQVIRDLAPDTGAIVRIGGVMGRHQLQASMPRSQDVGFGYFVASIVDSLRAGQPYTVFEGEGVNLIATPSLASEIAATINRVIERKATGCFHAVADDAIHRKDLALLVCDVYGFDPALIETGPPDASQRFSEPVPVDTSLDNTRVKEVLGVGAVSVRDLVEAFREEEDGDLHPVTPLH